MHVKVKVITQKDLVTFENTIVEPQNLLKLGKSNLGLTQSDNRFI